MGIQAAHTVEIAAPIERVYEAAADVPGAPAWNPAMLTVDVLETDSHGRATLVEAEADVKVKKSKSTLRFTYNGAEQPIALSWAQEKGEVKSVDGRWELEAIGPERTRATYALDIDPGRVLGMLLRGPVKDQVSELLTKGAAEGLKAHLESPPPG